MKHKLPTREEYLKRCSVRSLKQLRSDRVIDIALWIGVFGFSVYFFFYGYILIPIYNIDPNSVWIKDAKMIELIHRYGMLLYGLSLSRKVAKDVGYFLDIQDELKTRMSSVQQ